MMDLYVQGSCSAHEPPHVVDLITNARGGDYPDAECGPLEYYDITGICETCGYEVDGEFRPDEESRMPDHECDEEPEE